MFLLIILIAQSTALTLKQVSGCTCSMATVQTDCITTLCVWDSATSKCTNKSCDLFPQQSVCDTLQDSLGCAWKDSKCQVFTKCSDYQTDDGFSCYRKGPCQAVFKKNTAGLYPCTDKTNLSMHSIDTCSGIEQAGCVETVQNDGKVCYWNASSSSCEAWSSSACSNFDNTSQLACPKFSCDFDTTTKKCTTRTCSTILSQADCTMVWDIIQQNATPCQWVNNACVQIDYSTLPQTTCLTGSNLSYKWNTSTNKCEICQTQDTSNGFILTGVLILSMFIL